MSNSAPSATKCPRCGNTLPPNAPEGLCPRCLGALNLTGETAYTGAEAERKAPPSPEDIAPHFPQLEILECLGRGGMGVVYKARQKSLGRLIALKLLAPEREKDAQFAERFGREAQALAQLAHPNIVTIHDFGQSNGYFFLLMEFVDGVNLRELLRARRLTPEEALAIVPPLCEALQFAHERGIVHRDIKPENLLLAKDGRIKVVDFGIAKMLGAEVQVAEEKAAGTPGYMAPEQRETPQRVDSRADIYSLGVVFYEMLTGERPAEKFTPPSRRVAVDVRIDEVVLRALEKSPDLRWQTAAELGTRVESIAGAPAARMWHPERQRTFWFLALPAAVWLLGVDFLVLNLYVPKTTWSHSYSFGPNYGLLLATANALILCVALDVAVMRGLWIWAHAASAQPARVWHNTRIWWIVAFCCLLPGLFLPIAGRSPAGTSLAPPPPLEKSVEPQPTAQVAPPPGETYPLKTTAAPPSLPSTTLSGTATSALPELGAATQQAKIPLLSDIPLLGPLFTTPAANPKPSSNAQKFKVEEAQIRLNAAEKTMMRQAELHKQGLIGVDEYQKTALELELAQLALRAAQAEMQEAGQPSASPPSAEPPPSGARQSPSDAQKFKVEKAQLRFNAAEKAMKRQTELHARHETSVEDYEKTALEFDLAEVALRAAQDGMRTEPSSDAKPPAARDAMKVAQAIVVQNV